jgi:predicted amidohydrolase
MKVALVQLHALEPQWGVELIPPILALADEVDLVVLPEGMPFDKFRRPVAMDDAARCLASATQGRRSPALLAGGYVRAGTDKRNAVFLCCNGKCLGHYCKRLPWQEPGLVPGTSAVLLRWGRRACLPLICADAADNPSPLGTAFMFEALQLGVGERVPIIVASYGAWLNRPYWQEPLRTWALGCGAPVLICGVSGKGAAFRDGDQRGHYGGGGSGVFWPDGTFTQYRQRGLYVVDIEQRTLTERRLPKPLLA